MEIQLSANHKTIGIIGLGSIGMRHAKNLLAMGHTVVGIDPNDAALHAMDSRIQVHGFPWMLKNCDGTVVASPTTEHLEQLTDCIQAGVPCLIEKPIADRWADAVSEVLAVATSPTMVGNNLRFHSCVKKAKEWLAEGLIGKPLWASFCIAQQNTKYTDPVVLNWGAHEIDLALHLLGPAMVTAAAGNDQIMDVCLLHEYGVPSTVHMDYVTDPERRAFQIYGDKGQIFANLVNRTVSLLNKGDNAITDHLSDHRGSFDQDYKDEMQAFIDLIDGRPVRHAATGADGLACLELILEAQRMAAK